MLTCACTAPAQPIGSTHSLSSAFVASQVVCARGTTRLRRSASQTCMPRKMPGAYVAVCGAVAVRVDVILRGGKHLF